MYSIRNCSTLYVDQKNGVDRYLSGLTPIADGLGNGPFASLEFAFRVVKNLRATGNEQPLTISLVEDYFITSPIKVPKEVSNITIDSYDGRKRIIGGVQIGNWEKGSFNGVECLAAKLDNSISPNFTDIYVNGNRAKITRYPKSNTLRAIITEEQKTSYRDDSIVGHSKWFIARREDLENVDGIEDAIVNYYHYWIDEHSKIESFDRDSMKITMACASRFGLTTLYEEHAPSDMYYYLSNVPTSFGDEGEWYMDRKNRIVYYIPYSNEDINSLEVFAPVTDRLFDIGASDVHIHNLELCVTSCDYESHQNAADHYDKLTGLPIEAGENYGSDEQSVCCAPGAINIRSARRVKISDCYIHSLGIHAIAIEAGSNHIRIENNEICDVAAGGIKAFGGKYDAPEEYHVNDCFIIGNKIHDLGKRYEAGCGILICHAHDNVIEDNDIYNVGYSGISVGWVWGHAKSETHGNIIKRNHIHHIGHGTLSDMGGIYLLGRQHGTIVSENRIHDVNCENYGAWGIYLDEGSGSVTVENNVVFDTKKECFVIHYGSYNLVRNNIFVGTLGESPIHTGRNELLNEVLFERNILVSLDQTIYNPMCGHNTLGSKQNFVFDTKRDTVVMFKDRNGNEIGLDEWQTKFGQDINTIVINPEFASVDNRDFTPSENSPIYKLGFKKIPESVTRPNTK